MGVVVFAILTQAIFGRDGLNWDPVPGWWGAIIYGLVTTCLAITASYYLITLGRRERFEREAAEEATQRAAELDAQKLAELKTVTPLATLLELNQSQIDEYHRIATGQADRAFRASQTAMHTGLLIVAVCLAAGFFLQTAEATLFAGSVAAVGAALTGFLNRTYLRMYGQTLGQLNRYFEQPVLTQYYLTAERLSQHLDDSYESEMRKRIIEQVLDASQRLNTPNPQTEAVS